MSRVSADLLAALRPLLMRALDLEPAERESWLAAFRLEQPARAAELERLLAEEASLDARRFLSDGFSGAPVVSPGLAGQRLGAWTLERSLGQGGMGTVWLARRTDGRFEGSAAVKLLNLALLDPVGSERFRREGSLLARLSHPHIARLLDAGVTEGGQPYLVLEHVEGERIDRYCDARRLSPDQRLGLVQDVLAAVEHAHANLIVHRDLKPSNILVTPGGSVKLLDFSIAKLIEEGGGEASTLTDVGGRALTPEYAAPEQVAGGPITTATDVYALGVLLYVLLAGRHPTGEGRRTAAEYLKGVVETEPPRLSAAVTAADARGASQERLRRLYAGDLDNVVAKALKKDPGERYPTVSALADDLRRYRAHLPVSARPDSPWYRTTKFVRRNRTPVALGVLAVLGLTGAAARERTLRDRAEAETRNAVAVEQYLVTVFGAADPFAPPGDSAGEMTARILLDRGSRRIDSALADQPEVRARLRGALGRVYANLGLYDQAAAQLHRALAERRDLYGDRHESLAEPMDQLGVVLHRLGQVDSAEALLQAALHLRREYLGRRAEATAETLSHLSDLRREREDFVAAESLAREALATRRDLHGDGALPTAASKQVLAMLLSWRGANAEAAALHREALAVRERHLGGDHPRTAETMRELAMAERRLGHIQAAESLYRRALAAQRRGLGEVHPMVAGTLNDLADMLQKNTPRTEEAESLLRRALALNRQMLGNENGAVSTNLGNLAVIVREQGDFVEAERLLREALAIDRAVYGPEHSFVAYDMNELAAVLRLRGMPERAIPLLEQALAVSRRLSGTRHRNTAAVTIQLGRALRESGRLTEAVRAFREGLSTLDPANAETYALTIVGQVGLGRALTALGRSEEALPMLDSARVEGTRRLGAANWRVAEAHLGHAEALLALRRFAPAESSLASARMALDSLRHSQPVLSADLDRALRRLRGVR